MRRNKPKQAETSRERRREQGPPPPCVASTRLAVAAPPGTTNCPPSGRRTLASSLAERTGRRPAALQIRALQPPPVAVQCQSPTRLSSSGLPIGACPSALRRIPPRPPCPSDSTAGAVRLGPARRASPPRLARRRPVSPACRAFSALERFVTYELLRPRPSCGSTRGSSSPPRRSAPARDLRRRLHVR